MATRPHRNLELYECVGLQFAKESGLNQLDLEDIEMLFPASKGNSITHANFVEEVMKRLDKEHWQVKYVVYRDTVAQRSWHIMGEGDFYMLCKSCVKTNTIPVFTVIVGKTKKPEPPKALEEPKKDAPVV
jgi:hypothetical protein